MSHSSPSTVPTRSANLVFLVKAQMLQFIRGWQNIWNPAFRKWSTKASLDTITLPIGTESVSNLWVGATEAEWLLQAGKIHNLRQAIRQIDGIEIPAGGMFSFWAQVGRPLKLSGFASGRELREGCIIPTIGGGLCQLSNALYDAALKAGLEIIERHAHNQVIPGSLAEIGRDATVFWNYIDLRFRVATPLRIEVTMDDQTLSVKFRTVKFQTGKFQTVQTAPATATNSTISLPVTAANSCLSCGIISCFRQQQPQAFIGRTAYLVDDYWPEFDRYLQSRRTEQDYLLLPVDGQQIKKANYAWNTAGFGQVSQHRSILALRSAQSILLRIARQGAKYQQLLISQSRYLAQVYGRSLRVDATHIVVAQSLLPYLWQGGYLRGRSFEVLMTALPMQKLQSQLDLAAGRHLQSPTLNNFRVSPQIAEWEMAALQQAQRIVTPHAELATLWPEKTELLDWVMPIPHQIVVLPTISKPTLVLPSSSLGRKGIYELKAAVAGLDLHLIIVGGELEVPGFWQNCSMEYLPNYAQALQRATVVVAPAWVEHQPRRVLQSIAQGVPTIVSAASGLHHIPGLIQVPIGDVAALRKAIKSVVNKASTASILESA
jgi:VanW like protein/Glycosyl transferases group 1